SILIMTSTIDLRPHRACPGGESDGVLAAAPYRHTAPSRPPAAKDALKLLRLRYLAHHLIHYRDKPSGVLFFAMVALLCLVSSSFAQDRLPPIEFENPTLLYDPMQPVQPAIYPGDLSQPVVDDYHANDPNSAGRMYVEEEDGRIVPQQFSQISRSKNGFFQK